MNSVARCADVEWEREGAGLESRYLRHGSSLHTNHRRVGVSESGIDHRTLQVRVRPIGFQA